MKSDPTSPYRAVDQQHRRLTTLAEARRVRDALHAAPCFHNIANGQIHSSQEIADALTNCIEELSR